MHRVQHLQVLDKCLDEENSTDSAPIYDFL